MESVPESSQPNAATTDEMTPAERRAARKAVAPPSLDLTMQMRDVLAGTFGGALTAASQAEQVCSLVEAKADVSATDLDDGGGGNNPLMFCAQRAADPEILKRLLTAKADPLASNMEGFNVLHCFASRRSDAASPDMLRILLDGGASSLIQVQSLNGLTPLHVAAGWKDIDMCSMLLQAGASPSVRENGGDRPLEWAAKRKPNSYEMATLETLLTP